MATITFRRGTAAQWATANPVLAAGEPGLDLDSGRLKVGDGRTPWFDLAPFVARSADGAPGAAPPATSTIVLLGNSRIARERVGDQGGAAGMFVYANALAGGRFRVAAWSGVPGDRLLQMLERWPTDVAAHSPSWVLIGDGVNDASTNRTAEAMVDHTRSMIDLAREGGTRVILLTGPPNNQHTAAQRAELNAYNGWIKDLADPRVTPVDVATPVTDPGTGDYAAAYTTDGLHQNPAGATRIARVLAPVLERLLAPRDPFLASPTDARCHTLNPWVSGRPWTGWPTGWTSFGSASFTTEARTDAIPGGWMVMDSTAAATDGGLRQLQTSLPAGLRVGDTVRLVGEVQVDSLVALTRFQMTLRFRDAAGALVGEVAGVADNDAGALLASDFPLGQPMVFSSPPVKVPAGTKQLDLVNQLCGQGRVRYGRQMLISL